LFDFFSILFLNVIGAAGATATARIVTASAAKQKAKAGSNWFLFLGSYDLT
jgi:hypothetical protein